MLDGFAAVLRLAYDVWPSYGGTFVLVPMLVGLLLIPLTVRSARSARKLVVLQPEILRIQTAHAGNAAARNAETAALYRNHGVALGTGCLLIVLRLAILVVLFILVKGFVALDPSNGGGPKYVEQGTVLWQSLKDSGGQLLWFGVDLGKTMFTQGTGMGVWSYLMLLLVFVVITAVNMPVSAIRLVPQVVGSLFVTLVVALVLPGALVLYLVTDAAFNAGVRAFTTEQGRLRGQWKKWWRTPHQEFQAKSREADRLDAAGSSDAAATLRLSAIAEFGRKASVNRLVEYARDIQHNLVVAAARRPGDAVAALAELGRSCPQCVSWDMMSSVVRAWVHSPRLDHFGSGLAAIETMLAGKKQDLIEVLFDACCGVSRDEFTETFRRGVTTYLWTYLDRNLHLVPPAGRQVLNGHRPAFQILDSVGSCDLSQGDQLCALGDLALARESLSEALRRYEAAVELGSMQAAERLAYHQAREGHRLLSVGKIVAARRKFAEARMLHKDPEYAFLDAVAGLLSGDVDTRVVLDQLEALDGTGTPLPYVAFWRAINHLRRGEQDQAIALLRGLGRQHAGGNQSWGSVEEGAVLLAVLEDDDHALVDWARRLVRVYGDRWLAAGPAVPWPILGAVARHDQALLKEMVALIDDPDELPVWVRVAGAHALLTKSVELARRGLVGEAAGDVELAERLLRG